MIKELETARAGMFYWIREAYLQARKRGEEGVIEWQQAMEKGLSAGYENQNAPRDSGIQGFLKYVIERDAMLGLEAGGEILEADRRFSYWIKDLFIPLKDQISQEEYEQISTYGYLATKIRYFLPGQWNANMIKSPWLGSDRTEWVIEKNF